MVGITQVCVIEKRYANTTGLKKIYNPRKESDRRIANPARALRNESKVYHIPLLIVLVIRQMLKGDLQSPCKIGAQGCKLCFMGSIQNTPSQFSVWKGVLATYPVSIAGFKSIGYFSVNILILAGYFSSISIDHFRC